MPPLGQHHPLGAVGRASGAAGPRSSAPSHPTPLTPTLNLLRPTAALFHHSPTSHSQTSSTCASCRRLTPVRAIPGNSSSTTSGGFSRPSTALSAESITAEAISAEQDFLLKARKLSSRIAKLKRLQDKIARLKEEKDFLAAYMEVEASATDSDSEEPVDERDAQAPADPSPYPPSSSPPPGGPGGGGPEDLRSWVATLAAQSAARQQQLRQLQERAAGLGGTGGGLGAAGNGGSSNGNGAGSSWANGGSGNGGNGTSAAGGGGSAPMSALEQWRRQQQQQILQLEQQLQLQKQQQQQQGSAGGPSAWAGAGAGAPDAPVPGAGQQGQGQQGQGQQGQGQQGQGQAAYKRYSVRYGSPGARPSFVELPGSGGLGAPGLQGPGVAGAGPGLAGAPGVTGQPQQQAAMPPPVTQPPPPPPPPPAAAHPPVSQPSLAPTFSTPSFAPRAAAPPPTAPAAPTAPPPQQPAAPSPVPAPQPPPPSPQTPPLTSTTATTSSSPTTKPTTAAPTTKPLVPARDPNAELRPTLFPESLTSTNPYTLYDMPLPARPLPDRWRTAAERREDEQAATGVAPPAAADQHGRARQPRDLVFVTAEAAPWSKTGGLGDVMGALPKALAARGHRVMVVTPRYYHPSTARRYEGLKDTGVRARLDLGRAGGVHEVGYHHQHSDGVDWVFVDHISYHREGTPYGNAHGTYGDNLFRFALLCMAACEAPLLLHIGGYRSGQPPGLPYGQRVTFVANDWHAGLVPVYVAAKYRRHGVFRDARCVLALHNLAHQGSHPPAAFDGLGVPGEWYGAMEWVDTGAGGAAGGGGGGQGAAGGARRPTINVLKAALVTSDALVTVSQAYAWEVCGGVKGDAGAAGHGMGLSSLLRQRSADLRGIVNGIDTKEWDPRTDPYIPHNYHEGSLGGKALCKAALQEALRLPVDPAAPLLGFIGRLDYQKGPDLVLGALPQLVAMGCQVVMLGSGAADYEEALRAAQAAYPASVRSHVGFSVPLSHKILAGADILLMPSRFEPCGLNQLYAMRYGTVPVAHATGGLRDTIDDVDPFVGEEEEEQDIEELFRTALAWGKSTGARALDDPEFNNREHLMLDIDPAYKAAPRSPPTSTSSSETSTASASRSGTNGTNGRGSLYGNTGARRWYEEEDEDDGYAWDRETDGSDGDGTAGGDGGRRGVGTGWTFAPATVEGLMDAMTAALLVYERHPDKWREVQVAGMRRDSSWGRAARHWEAVFEGALTTAAYCK